jgi:uncharacterized membrane protein YkoI
MNASQLFILFVLLLFPLEGLVAANQEGQPQTRLLQTQNEDPQTNISRRQAYDIARENFSGRVLSIRLEHSGWRVRMDQDGTVFNILVHADTGAISRPSE